MKNVYIHPTAQVEENVQIGKCTTIWSLVQVRSGATIGAYCNLGKNTYIDCDVSIGDNCKIQNNASIYRGTTIESGVFIGPHVVFANDKLPRAITPEGKVKSETDWVVSPTVVQYGASVGAQSVILPGVTIGRYSLIGSGSVVSRDVPAHSVVFGNPATVHKYICTCEQTFQFDKNQYTCVCGRSYSKDENTVTMYPAK